ncbi:MAG: HAMP domain-containing protein [Proteobacteria bacterium]|nr:HAMP domain-containing protein [Pseudomonadota bacterium]
MFKIKKTNVTTRSIFLVNRPFQFKYSILLSLLGGLVAALFAAHVFYFLNENIHVFIPNFSESPEIAQVIFGEQKKIAIYLMVLIFLVMCVLFFLGIILTHKIMGPVLVLKRKMQDVAEGRYSARVYLRKGDELKDLAVAFNSMAKTLQEKSRPKRLKPLKLKPLKSKPKRLKTRKKKS